MTDSNPRKIKQDIVWSSSYFTPCAWMFCGKNPERRQNNEQEIFVVNGARNALLGRPAIETLAIVQKVDAVEATNLKQSFQDFSLDLEKFEFLTMS